MKLRKEIDMRKLKVVLLTIVGFTIISCQSNLDLHADKYLTEVFSENELQEIEKMIHYVDDRVIEKTDNKDINQAYHQLLDKIDQTVQDSSRFLVPFEEEEKYKFLESLDSTLFHEFWYMGNGITKTTCKDSIYENLDNYKFLELTPRGRYADYLERIGEDDEYYKSVKDNLDAAGAFTPTIAAGFLRRHNEFDFTIPKNRLWAVVYILRIEEDHDKKMQRVLLHKPI